MLFSNSLSTRIRVLSYLVATLSFFICTGAFFFLLPDNLQDGGWTLLGGILALLAVTLGVLTPLIQRYVSAIAAPLADLSAYTEAIHRGKEAEPPPAPPSRAPIEVRTLHTGVDALAGRLESAQSMLVNLSITDQLTGLCNRRHLESEGERIAATCLRASTPCSCMMIDIDHFKSINDAFGHAVGDDALRFVASLIQNCCRTSDLAARYGGEEFAVLAPNSTSEQCITLANRIMETIRSTPVVTPDMQFHLSVSIGVADLSSELLYGVSPFEDMLSKADKALYAAKTAGRDRATLFGDIQWPPPRA